MFVNVTVCGTGLFPLESQTREVLSVYVTSKPAIAALEYEGAVVDASILKSLNIVKLGSEFAAKSQFNAPNLIRMLTGFAEEVISNMYTLREGNGEG